VLLSNPYKKKHPHCERKGEEKGASDLKKRLGIEVEEEPNEMSGIFHGA